MKKWFRFLKIICCAALLWGGALQADNYSIGTSSYGYCSNGSCTISGDWLTTHSNFDGNYNQWLLLMNSSYISVTVDSDFSLDVTQDSQGIFAIWTGHTVGTLTNNGTLKSTGGDIIRVGVQNSSDKSGEISTIINNGTLSSGTGNAIFVNTTGKVDEIINNQTIEGNIKNTGTIGSITNESTITGNIINGGLHTDDGSVLIGTITGDIINNGTITGDITNDYGTITGDIINNDTITGNITNSDTITGDIINDEGATITGDITNNEDSTITGTITNNGTINGTITNSGTITGSITNGESGTITSITNSGEIDDIYNSGTIDSGITSTSESSINIYNYQSGSIGLNSSGAQLSGNFNISEWYFVIDESSDEFNSFSGSESSTSHIIVNGNITLDNAVLTIGLSDSFSYYNETYLLDQLIYDISGSNDSDDDVFSALSLSSDLQLEYELLRTDENGNKDDNGEYFMIYYDKDGIDDTVNTNFKNSPAHLFYQNTISQLDNIVHQTELTMYSNAKCHNTDTRYSESDDDCFFFAPFITHNNIYNSGDGLSYGFVSGYNKQLEHSLFGVHIGFSYGNIESDYLSNHLDMNTMLLLLGLHYRYMFDNNLYVKLRGDFFYAMHDVKGNYITSDPDSLGLNIGASMGAQIHINKESPLYGVVDIETGIRYTGLNNSAFVFDANYNGATYQESHKSSFTNLAYFDINAKYDKYLGDSNQWTINTVIGAQMLIPSLPTIETTAIATKSHTTKSYIDINEIEGYVLFGVDYKVSNNVSLMLNYLGIYGDKSMSNSGFFNIRVWW